jgi:hypothetical protein
MAAVDNTAASAYLKNRFSKKRIQNLSYEGSPLFAMLPKKEDFGGENLKVPVSYADLKGRSATFAVAQANKQGSDTARFLITTVKDYALFSIQGQTIKQSRGDLNAWLPALEKEAESAARALARSASWAVFRSSVGHIGTVGSNSGANITLASRADVQNFEVGMTIQLVNPAGTTSARSGKLKISAIYRDDGVLGCNATVTSAISAAANADLIVPEGDLNARISGLDSWIPNTDALAASTLFSQDRSADVARLGGLRFDASGMNILEAVTGAAARAAENGARPDKLFINFDRWRELCNYLGSQKIYTQGTAYAPSGQPKADVSFEGVKIHGPNSVIEVYADRHCQPSTGWLLQMDTWTLHSTGGVPMLLEEDGQSILREATDDAYEGRWGAYYQLYTNAPGYNMKIKNL